MRKTDIYDLQDLVAKIDEVLLPLRADDEVDLFHALDRAKDELENLIEEMLMETGEL